MASDTPHSSNPLVIPFSRAVSFLTKGKATVDLINDELILAFLSSQRLA